MKDISCLFFSTLQQNEWYKNGEMNVKKEGEESNQKEEEDQQEEKMDEEEAEERKKCTVTECVVHIL